MHCAQKSQSLLQFGHRLVEARVKDLWVDGVEVQGQLHSIQSVIGNDLANCLQALCPAFPRLLTVRYPASQGQGCGAEFTHAAFLLTCNYAIRWRANIERIWPSAIALSSAWTAGAWGPYLSYATNGQFLFGEPFEVGKRPFPASIRQDGASHPCLIQLRPDQDRVAQDSMVQLGLHQSRTREIRCSKISSG